MEDTDEPEVMTLKQVAEYLQLADKSVLRMAQRGEIPAIKIASQWRFLRTVVRGWLAAQMQVVPRQKLPGPAGWDEDLLPLREVFRAELMNLRVEPGPKEAVLRQLVQPLCEAGFVRHEKRLLAGLLQREAMMTTAVGHRVALPHPRRTLPGVFREPAVALGICPRGTGFDAVDDTLVHAFFLICATREETHLRLMAKVGWLARQPDTIDALCAVSTPRQALRVIREASRNL
jgi:PTS system nitrogen regulatory IIA component